MSPPDMAAADAALSPDLLDRLSQGAPPVISGFIAMAKDGDRQARMAVINGILRVESSIPTWHPAYVVIAAAKGKTS